MSLLLDWLFPRMPEPAFPDLSSERCVFLPFPEDVELEDFMELEDFLVIAEVLLNAPGCYILPVKWRRGSKSQMPSAGILQDQESSNSHAHTNDNADQACLKKTEENSSAREPEHISKALFGMRQHSAVQALVPAGARCHRLEPLAITESSTLPAGVWLLCRVHLEPIHETPLTPSVIRPPAEQSFSAGQNVSDSDSATAPQADPALRDNPRNSISYPEDTGTVASGSTTKGADQ